MDRRKIKLHTCQCRYTISAKLDRIMTGIFPMEEQRIWPHDIFKLRNKELRFQRYLSEIRFIQWHWPGDFSSERTTHLLDHPLNVFNLRTARQQHLSEIRFTFVKRLYLSRTVRCLVNFIEKLWNWRNSYLQDLLHNVTRQRTFFEFLVACVEFRYP